MLLLLSHPGAPEAIRRPARSFPLRRSAGTISLSAAAAQIHPVSTGGWLRQRVKFLLRAFSQPHYTRAWLARLVQPDLAPLWAARPRLATKLQRPYLCCEWGVPERFAALLGHYDALTEISSIRAREKIYHGGLVFLHLSHAVSSRHLVLRLAYRDQFEKEGELTLELVDSSSALILAGITFTLTCSGEKRAIIIGGLQASPDPRMRDLIHDVAKEMHGLRPKAFLLWCLQQLGTRWKISELQAIDDAHHIYRHWRKRRAFAASYDEFWIESDGQRLPEGGWRLPLQLHARSRAELKPSRRKAHERRYAMFAALRPQLLAALDSLTPAVPTNTMSANPLEFVYSNQETAAHETTPVAAPVVRQLHPELADLNHSF